MEQDTAVRWLMFPQGASVTVKQRSYLNNFIMKNLSVKPLNKSNFVNL